VDHLESVTSHIQHPWQGRHTSRLARCARRNGIARCRRFGEAGAVGFATARRRRRGCTHRRRSKSGIPWRAVRHCHGSVVWLLAARRAQRRRNGWLPGHCRLLCEGMCV